MTHDKDVNIAEAGYPSRLSTIQPVSIYHASKNNPVFETVHLWPLKLVTWFSKSLLLFAEPVAGAENPGYVVYG